MKLNFDAITALNFSNLGPKDTESGEDSLFLEEINKFLAQKRLKDILQDPPSEDPKAPRTFDI